MHRLAKLGFTQSYTYFTWRNTKQELTEYFTELAHGPGARLLPSELLAEHAGHPARAPAVGGRAGVRDRGSCWPPTLAANYGIYGPAFELHGDTPREPGSEEYLDSEKYELRHWDLERADSLRSRHRRS